MKLSITTKTCPILRQCLAHKVLERSEQDFPMEENGSLVLFVFSKKQDITGFIQFCVQPLGPEELVTNN